MQPDELAGLDPDQLQAVLNLLGTGDMSPEEASTEVGATPPSCFHRVLWCGPSGKWEALPTVLHYDRVLFGGWSIDR